MFFVFGPLDDAGRDLVSADTLTDAPEPCPDSAPERQLEAAAVPVPITYNNWGDFDPQGRVLVPLDDLPTVLDKVIQDLERATLEDGTQVFPNMLEKLDAARQEVPDDVTLEEAKSAAQPLSELDQAWYEDQDQSLDAIESGKNVTEGLSPLDVIEPYTIRAHLGECVTLNTVNLLPEAVGLHIHGLRTHADQGDVELDPGADTNVVSPGNTGATVAYIPDVDGMEGGHFIHSHADQRFQTRHGLFGALVAQQPGTTWLEKSDNTVEADSGLEVIIDAENPSDFREFVMIYHDEVRLHASIPSGPSEPLEPLPVISPYGEYGPGTKAINYRSEPFMKRFGAMEDEFNEDQPVNDYGDGKFDKSQGYGSYTYGDPGTFIPESYLGDPTKMRLMNAGPGQDHVHHLHGGGIRWKLSPVGQNVQMDAGLEKSNDDIRSESERIDVQTLSPGESFNAEIEGGAGGVQQSVGDFLMHCHIVEHYVSGMWTFWRVYNTTQPGLAELPDRSGQQSEAVNSVDLYEQFLEEGELPDGRTANLENFQDWVEQQLPAQGLPGPEEADVWDWQKQKTTISDGDLVNNQDGEEAYLYLGERETNKTWANYRLDDRDGLSPGDRPEILFNPDDGEADFPLLRPHLGNRTPFAPDHGPSPYLGEETEQHNPEGLCPTKDVPGMTPPAEGVRPWVDYNITAIEQNVEYDDEHVDDDSTARPQGLIFAHSEEADSIAPDEATSLVLRGNVGDCVDVTLTNDMEEDPNLPTRSGKRSQVNMHIHLVQFDIQASDGVIVGFNYEQSVRPADTTDATLEQGVDPDDSQQDPTTIEVSDWQPFFDERDSPKEGATLGVGLTEGSIEQREIDAVQKNGDGTATITLKSALENTHTQGEEVGFEFVNYQWYLDTELGMVYWHDHVDGLTSWASGLFGGLVVEPRDSQWCDPNRDAPNDNPYDCGDKPSDHVVDVINEDEAAQDDETRNYREVVLQVQDRACVNYLPDDRRGKGDCTLGTGDPQQPKPVIEPGSFNLRSEPLHDRNRDLPLNFSTNGETFETTDVQTAEAYPGDETIYRIVYAGQTTTSGVGTFSMPGQQFQREQHLDGSKNITAAKIGISDQKNFRFKCGSGGCGNFSGDYLFKMGEPNMTHRGMWGVHRVHDEVNSSVLQPLPWNQNPPDGGIPSGTEEWVGDTHSYDVTALDVDVQYNGQDGLTKPTKVFALSKDAADIESGAMNPKPLVLRAHEGDLVEITLTNELDADEAVTFTPSLLWANPSDAYGIPVGDNPDTTVAPGETRTFTYFANETGTSLVTSHGNMSSLSEFGDKFIQNAQTEDGLYAAISVLPEGHDWVHATGPRTSIDPPSGDAYREHVLMFQEDDAQFETSTMPYANHVKDITSVNYRTDSLNHRLGAQDHPEEENALVGGTAIHSCDIEPFACGGTTTSDGEPFTEGLFLEVRNPLNPVAHEIRKRPATPMITAQEGQQTVVRFVNAGGEQVQTPTIDGHWWATDPDRDNCRSDLQNCDSNIVSARSLGPGEVTDAWIPAAGPGGQGDYWWSTHRDAFHEGGAWGIFRVCEANRGIDSTGQICATDQTGLDAEGDVGDQIAAFDQLATDIQNNCDNLTPHECLETVTDDPTGCLDDTSAASAEVRLRPGGMVTQGHDIPSLSGFSPHCVKLASGGVVQFFNDDYVTHDPATKADWETGTSRCFRASDHNAGGALSSDHTDPFNVTLRYWSNETLEVSTDGGDSWRDCSGLVDPELSTSSLAVLRYLSDTHPDTEGLIAIEAQ